MSTSPLLPAIEKFERELTGSGLSTAHFVGALLRLQSSVVVQLEAGDHHEFARGWLLHSIATDLLRYSIEDDYVQIDSALLDEAADALRRLASQQQDLGQLAVGALQVLRNVAALKPLRAQTVEVRVPFQGRNCHFRAFLATKDEPQIQVSSQARPLVPILEESVSLPNYAESVVGAFGRMLDRFRRDFGITALCFVEKTAGPVGALAMHTALVRQLGMPACIYRDNYWVGRARLTGYRPRKNERVAIVYDLLVTGDGVRHVANGLDRLGIKAVAAGVLSGFETPPNQELSLDSGPLHVDAILWQDGIATEIEEVRTSSRNSRHILFVSDTPESSHDDATTGSRSGRQARPATTDINWRSNLFAYDEVTALAFESDEDFSRALDLLFSDKSLLGMPTDMVGGRTLIVPAGAATYFEGLSFKVQTVVSSSDVSAEELSALRQQQGHH